MLFGFIVAIFAIWIAYKVFKPRLRGHAGESRVCRVLDRYHIPYKRDLRLIGANGRPYQVDVLAWIGGYFIVLEVKNYSGVIDGWADDKMWTQHLGRNRYRFYNPLRQNYGHVLALRENFPGLPFEGLVIFAGNARMAVGFPRGVMDLRKFKSYLDRPYIRSIERNMLVEGWAQIEAMGIDRASRVGRRKEKLRAWFRNKASSKSF